MRHRKALLPSLPKHALHKIFSYLRYHQVAKMREVSVKLNKRCGDYLSGSFYQFKEMLIDSIHKYECLVPSSCPNRRNLPGYRCLHELYILYRAIHRIENQYKRWIGRGYHPFIAGKVLDVARLLVARLNNGVTCGYLLRKFRLGLVPKAVKHHQAELEGSLKDDLIDDLEWTIEQQEEQIMALEKDVSGPHYGVDDFS